MFRLTPTNLASSSLYSVSVAMPRTTASFKSGPRCPISTRRRRFECFEWEHNGRIIRMERGGGGGRRNRANAIGGRGRSGDGQTGTRGDNLEVTLLARQTRKRKAGEHDLRGVMPQRSRGDVSRGDLSSFSFYRAKSAGNTTRERVG